MTRRIAVALADLLFLILGSAQVWLSLRLPNGIGLSAAEPGPGLFPMMVGCLMCVAAAAHLASNANIRLEGDVASEGSALAVVMLVSAIAGYILLLPRAGFFLSAFALLLCTLSIYGMPGLGRRVGTALLATAMAYGVFTRGLGVSMPTPSWFQ